MPTEEAPLLQLKISLLGLRPPIWRRVVVPADYHLGHLHQIIQLAMGWQDSHLHQFRVEGRRYSQPAFELENAGNENQMTLAEAFPEFKGKIQYEYDFGDSWLHEVACEGLPKKPPTQLPGCVTARRHCPPDDIGGIYGYVDFLEAALDPDHEEHHEVIEWYGGEFDPEFVSLQVINQKLAAWLEAGREYPKEWLG